MDTADQEKKTGSKLQLFFGCNSWQTVRRWSQRRERRLRAFRSAEKQRELWGSVFAETLENQLEKDAPRFTRTRASGVASQGYNRKFGRSLSAQYKSNDYAYLK